MRIQEQEILHIQVAVVDPRRLLASMSNRKAHLLKILAEELFSVSQSHRGVNKSIIVPIAPHRGQLWERTTQILQDYSTLEMPNLVLQKKLLRIALVIVNLWHGLIKVMSLSL